MDIHEKYKTRSVMTCILLSAWDGNSSRRTEDPTRIYSSTSLPSLNEIVSDSMIHLSRRQVS